MQRFLQPLKDAICSLLVRKHVLGSSQSNLTSASQVLDPIKKAPPGELQVLSTLCHALQARLEPAQDMFAAGMSSAAAAVAAAELHIAAELLYAYPSARQLAQYLASGQPAPSLENSEDIPGK